MSNVEVLNLAKTPIWDMISTYCAISNRGTVRASREYLHSSHVPPQLRKQVKEVGDSLIANNIEP